MTNDDLYFMAERDVGIKQAECQNSAMDIRYSTDTKIEDNSRVYNLQKANFDKKVNTAVFKSGFTYAKYALCFHIAL